MAFFLTGAVFFLPALLSSSSSESDDDEDDEDDEGGSESRSPFFFFFSFGFSPLSLRLFSFSLGGVGEGAILM